MAKPKNTSENGVRRSRSRPEASRNCRGKVQKTSPPQTATGRRHAAKRNCHSWNPSWGEHGDTSWFRSTGQRAALRFPAAMMDAEVVGRARDFQSHATSGWRADGRSSAGLRNFEGKIPEGNYGAGSDGNGTAGLFMWRASRRAQAIEKGESSSA